VNEERHQTLRDVLVFLLLVGIGVGGRWGQPEWCVTPTAAAAIFAGCYFARVWVAALVPVAILAISDLILPSYSSREVMVVTYAALVFPVVLGRWLRRGRPGWSAVWRWGICGLLPATVFYFATNFAVWAFESDYARSWNGLLHCYLAAVPFFRWMLAGDAFYLAVLFGCAALSDVRFARPALAELPAVRNHQA